MIKARQQTSFLFDLDGTLVDSVYDHVLAWHDALQEEGIEQMRQGLAAHQAAGAKVARPHFLALLAEGLGKSRQFEEGLLVLEEALELVDRNGERCYLAELHRIRGELLLRQAADRGLLRAATGGKAVVEYERAQIAAEECFDQSIKIAQQQKARSWELRAAMSLVRLRERHPDRDLPLRARFGDARFKIKMFARGERAP